MHLPNHDFCISCTAITHNNNNNKNNTQITSDADEKTAVKPFDSSNDSAVSNVNSSSLKNKTKSKPNSQEQKKTLPNFQF
jgi:hypothetical protein